PPPSDRAPPPGAAPRRSERSGGDHRQPARAGAALRGTPRGGSGGRTARGGDPGRILRRARVASASGRAPPHGEGRSVPLARRGGGPALGPALPHARAAPAPRAQVRRGRAPAGPKLLLPRAGEEAE